MWKLRPKAVKTRANNCKIVGRGEIRGERRKEGKKERKEYLCHRSLNSHPLPLKLAIKREKR